MSKLISHVANEFQSNDCSAQNVKFSNADMINLLLFGDDKLNIVSNRMILEATISFIEKTKRLH